MAKATVKSAMAQTSASSDGALSVIAYSKPASLSTTSAQIATYAVFYQKLKRLKHIPGTRKALQV
jgi:hypothetical protein